MIYFSHVGEINFGKFKPEIKDRKIKPMDLNDIMIKQQPKMEEKERK